MSLVQAAPADPFADVVGESAEAEQMRAFGRRAAAVSAAVLLTGETGSGKGVLARSIHAASARSRAPFVVVNCAGVPEPLFESEFFGHARGAFTGAHYAHRGLLEQSHGGTLFLDEVGELPLLLQAKLLTVLDEGEVRRVGGERSVHVDVRLIAATAQDLEAAVEARRFRLDLFHRLLVLGFAIPPLRARGDDAVLLARHFLARHGRRYARPARAFSAGAERRIRDHVWPGNVRELCHAVEAAVLAADGPVVLAAHLPLRRVAAGGAAVPPGGGAQAPELPAALDAAAPAAGPPPARRARYSFFGSPAEERASIIAALGRSRGNKTRAAAQLGMTRNTLRARMRALSLADPSPPEATARSYDAAGRAGAIAGPGAAP